MNPISKCSQWPILRMTNVIWKTPKFTLSNWPNLRLTAQSWKTSKRTLISIQNLMGTFELIIKVGQNKLLLKQTKNHKIIVKRTINSKVIENIGNVEELFLLRRPIFHSKTHLFSLVKSAIFSLIYRHMPKYHKC